VLDAKGVTRRKATRDNTLTGEDRRAMSFGFTILLAATTKRKKSRFPFAYRRVVALKAICQYERQFFG
jgi:hypothetical protein